MNDGNHLGDFLRARREQVTPADVGLVDHGRRQVAGLRREEVALLAGVSVAYYVRLEQGHNRNPSGQVLDTLADALVLDEAARRHLHTLVGAQRSTATRRSVGPERVRPGLAHMLGEHVDAPALVLGRALDVLAANPLAEALHPSYRPGCNLARDVFLLESAQSRYVDLGQVRHDRVGSLREAAGALPDDPRITEVVGELSVKSEAFRRLWARHEIHTKSDGTKRFVHPDVGELELEYSFFTFTDHERQHLLVYYPSPQSVHAQALALIGALAAGEPDPPGLTPASGASRSHPGRRGGS